MKKKDRQRQKVQEELSKIAEEIRPTLSNYQDEYIRDIIATSQAIGLELLKLNRPEVFQNKK